MASSRVQIACVKDYAAVDAISLQSLPLIGKLRIKRSPFAPFVRDLCMDDFDVKILDALQRDGQMTNYDLAALAGLSASQCSRRRAALEEDGVIEGYHAKLSAEKLGLKVHVFVQVTLATHSPDNSKRFARLISGLEEVQEAYALTGEADYVLKLVVEDLQALSRILNDVLLPHQSVAHVRSSIVLERLKHTNELPLRKLRKGDSSAAKKRRGRTTLIARRA
jgi:DNA-binding Lrp family transcriptional regulator